MKLIVLLMGLGACRVENTLRPPEPGLERMLKQPRADAFEASAAFRDGRVMQVPPLGTVPTDRGPNDARATGMRGGAEVTAIPVPLSMATLQRGRERFDIYCAPCHGARGDADTFIARRMPLVRPRNLHDARVREASDGRLFRVVSEGYGLMAGYAVQLSVEDRWAVVAYVRALELSRRVALADLPGDVADAAREALR